MPPFKYILKKNGVTLLDEKRIILKCNHCGQIWSPNIQSGGRLPKGYWKCPNGCNYEPKEYKHPKEVRAYFAKRTREYRQRKKEGS
jgi:hypothetical protein